MVKELPGDVITGKPQSYESVDFGVLSQKEIIQTLKGSIAERNNSDSKGSLLGNPTKTYW
jgi:hypothetical protein